MDGYACAKKSHKVCAEIENLELICAQPQGLITNIGFIDTMVDNGFSFLQLKIRNHRQFLLRVSKKRGADLAAKRDRAILQ